MTIDETSLIAHPFRGIKRCLLACSVVLLLLAGIWTSWWLTERHRLQTRLAIIRSRHEAISVDELLQNSLPPEQDASRFWRKAIDAIPSDVVYSENSLCGVLAAGSVPGFPPAMARDFPSGPPLVTHPWLPLPLAWERLESANIRRETDSLDMARKASELPGINYHPGAGFNLSMDGDAMTLGNMLCDAALYAHIDESDDAAAIDRLNTAMRETADVARTNLSVDYRCELPFAGVRVITTLQEIAPDLSVGDRATNRNGNPAPHAAVMQMIGELLDEKEFAKNVGRQSQYTRVQIVDGLDSSQSESIFAFPWFDAAKVRACDTSLAQTASVFEPSFPASQTRLRSERDAMRSTDSQIDQLQTDFFRPYWTEIASQRMLAVTLAIRLYQLDHGKRPGQLQDLVPSYLPAVPADPFSSTNAPIGFVIRKGNLPGGKDRPLLSSGVPDPAAAPLPSVPCYGPLFAANGNLEFPIWRDLERWTP